MMANGFWVQRSNRGVVKKQTKKTQTTKHPHQQISLPSGLGFGNIVRHDEFHVCLQQMENAEAERDVYDELLTQAEIQGNVNQVNGEFGVRWSGWSQPVHPHLSLSVCSVTRMQLRSRSARFDRLSGSL